MRRKQFFLQISLDDVDKDNRLDEDEFQSRWWGFINDIEVL